MFDDSLSKHSLSKLHVGAKRVLSDDDTVKIQEQKNPWFMMDLLYFAFALYLGSTVSSAPV